MSYKYGQLVSIKNGFYKGQKGFVISAGEAHVGGYPGDIEDRSYGVVLLSTKSLVEVEGKDLQPETLQEQIETGENIENGLENEIEEVAEQIDEEIENNPEIDPRELK